MYAKIKTLKTKRINILKTKKMVQNISIHKTRFKKNPYLKKQ